MKPCLEGQMEGGSGGAWQVREVGTWGGRSDTWGAEGGGQVFEVV